MTDKLDLICEEIKSLSEMMRDFRESPLNDRCIIVLLKDITGHNMSTIKQVLNGVEALESVYLKDVDGEA